MRAASHARHAPYVDTRPPRPRPVLRHGPGRWFRDWLGEALIRLGRRVRGKPRKWPRIER